MKQNTGFFLSVFRSVRVGDCSMGGASSKHNEIFVIADGQCIKEGGPFCEADAIKRGIPVFEVGKKGDQFNFKPKGETSWTMFGGNFAYSSDSRCPSHPTHIHDRIER